MRRLIAALRRRLRDAARGPGPAKPAFTPLSLPRALAAEGQDFRGWWERRRREGAGRLYVEAAPQRVAQLRAQFPERAAALLPQAERLLRHEFELLGSGPFTPMDPERPRSADGYAPLDWRLDPRSGLRFPHGFPCRQWDLAAMAPPGADVKLPWELGRLQHWPLLAQAALLGDDARFAREIVRQLADFREANPLGIGVQWVCTMDVALRSVSLAITAELLRHTAQLADADFEALYDALFEHADFVRNHLENHYEVTSNHYLSNLLGLLFAGAVFRDVEAGASWWRFARTEIGVELGKQVLDDGADYESSIPYHRLVTELFLAAAHLAAFAGEPYDDAFLGRLESMVDYLAGTLRPDGFMPQVGDADDGRLHLLSGHGTRPPGDPRHLFAPAVGVLKAPRFAPYLDDEGPWEAAWWGLDVAGGAGFRPLPATRLWPDAGVAVHRRDGAYLLVTNGRVGTLGFGNHKHNDQLGFELHLGGRALVVDPGSYLYTPAPAERNRFRGTAYHSTVQIDGEEQNELRPDWLFRLFQSGTLPELMLEEREDGVVIRGRHTGYSRLASPVVHERTFRAAADLRTLVVIDRFFGHGSFELAWRLHLAPGVVAKAVDGRSWRLAADGVAVSLCFAAEQEVRCEAAYHSPSYGVRVPCAALSWRERGAIAGQLERRFALLGDPELPLRERLLQPGGD